MPAPFVIAALAAGATWLTSAALNMGSLKDDNLSQSVYSWEGKDGKVTEIPVSAAVGVAGLLSVMVLPAALGAIGLGMAAGAVSSYTTTTQLKAEVEAAKKQIASGDIPEWLYDMAAPHLLSET